MTQSKLFKTASVVVLSLAVLTLLTSAAFAQTQKVEGIIKGRSGNTMTLTTSDASKLVVVLYRFPDGIEASVLQERLEQCFST